ncbi:MAG: hypothetical protein IJX56_04500, partial [Alistipes sp.]|nr:hypothetical protein [Alistipes sp.]
VTEPGAEVIVPAGTYTFPTTWGEGVKMICSEDTVFEGTSSLNIKGATVVNATFENTSGTAASGTVNGTFQNCSFIGGNNGLRWCYAGDTAVFENCTIYGEVYGIHFDGGANEVIMRNCDVTGWSSFGGAVNQVTIEECRFHKSGYGRLRFYQDATVTDTTFDADFQGIDCGDGGAGFGGLTLTLNGCTYAGGVMSDLANITDKDVWKIDGTQALPANVVVVSSAAALAEVATAIAAGETYEGKVLRLTSDVTLSGEFTPIAAGVRSGNQAVGTGFKGTFDGQGKTISGLTITSSGESDAIGFFGIVDGGEVKNVNFTNVNIDVTSKNAGTAVGLLVNGGKVSGVTVSGSVKGYQGLGGVVGRILSNGTIENCTNNATITSTGYNVGGIVGAAYYTVEGAEMTISGCVNKGEVNCGTNGAGGIVGLSAANVVDCENTANVTGKGTSVGGLVGEQQNAGSVKNSINRGDVKNNAVAYGTGGVIGWVRYNGAVADYPRKEAIEVIGNTNYGRVTGGNDAGGIVGTLYGLGYVNQNENYAQELSGSAFVAGIVANAQFTEPLLGMTESYYAEVNNNLSTTTLDQMTGNCKALYVYDNNQGACLTQTGNRQN